MGSLYGQDLAYIQAAGFGGFSEGAAPEIVRMLKSAAVPIRRVVDLGCGAGVLSAALINAGFDVTGIDNSAGLLAIAAATVPGARFVEGSIYDIEIPSCEAILGIGEPLTYHTDVAEAERVVESFFHRAAGILPSGGMLIFDVIETGEPSLAGRFWTSGADWAVLADTTEDRDSHTLIRAIETFRKTGDLYRRGHEVHQVHVFDTKELAGMLAGCGFETRTAQSYGAQRLAPRRRAFLGTRL